MNICGVLVHCDPRTNGSVADALASMAGVEVHGDAPGARLIVTVEDTETAVAADQILAIHRLPGVISAALTYHNFESNEAAPVQPTDASAAATSTGDEA